MMNMPSVLRLIGAVFFLATLPAQVHALTPDQVFDKVKNSIVVVKTVDAAGKVKGQGSGVLLPSGKIATNCHVVEGGASYQVGWGKQLFFATLYAEDRDKDICLLDAKGITGTPAQLGKAAGLKVGFRFMLWERRRVWNFPFPTVLSRNSVADRHPSFRPQQPSLPVQVAGVFSMGKAGWSV
jgi:hypothetical protein